SGRRSDEARSYLRLVPVDGESLDQSLVRLRPWLEGLSLPTGQRVVLASRTASRGRRGRGYSRGNTTPGSAPASATPSRSAATLGTRWSRGRRARRAPQRHRPAAALRDARGASARFDGFASAGAARDLAVPGRRTDRVHRIKSRIKAGFNPQPDI